MSLFVSVLSSNSPLKHLELFSTIFIVFFVCRRPLTANHYFKYFVKWRFLCFEQLSYTLDSTLLYSNIILSLLLGFRPKLLDLFSYVCTITYTVMYFSPLEKNYVRHNLLIVDTVGSVGSYLWRKNKLRFYRICYTFQWLGFNYSNTKHCRQFFSTMFYNSAHLHLYYVHSYVDCTKYII